MAGGMPIPEAALAESMAILDMIALWVGPDTPRVFDGLVGGCGQSMAECGSRWIVGHVDFVLIPT